MSHLEKRKIKQMKFFAETLYYANIILYGTKRTSFEIMQNTLQKYFMCRKLSAQTFIQSKIQGV